jgi:tetratricopeptide (TPR) repeat protein
MPKANPLQIFVAMPGTDMGPNATYKNPESVKANLLQPVAEKLQAKTGREVSLVIEKDKRAQGVIHASMFAEARDADIYIADLTGANPNVYLELGVRWALRDRITVLIVQSVADLKFNVFANRAILYYPDIIIKAIDDVVAAIENGLKDNRCDSPVRLNSEFVAIPKAQLASLEAELERLQRVRGEDLLRAAGITENLTEKIAILKQAVDTNPASVQALLQLGIAYRDLSQYGEAEAVLQSVVRLDPHSAVVHRELGVCYSKQGKPDLAAHCLREAVRLAPNDVEAWSNLGGALRRLGMAGAPHRYDQKALEEARESYHQAHKLDKYNLYAGLNVARLDLLLSKWNAGRLAQAKEGFRKQIHLCRHAVEENPQDYWRQFDLGDALLFSDEYDEAQKVFANAVTLIPAAERQDKLLSVLGPLRAYLTSQIFQGTLQAMVQEIVRDLEATVS